MEITTGSRGRFKKKKSRTSLNCLTYFMLAVTYGSRTLQSELKTFKTQLSEMNDSCYVKTCKFFLNCLKTHKKEMVSMATDVKSSQIFFMFHAKSYLHITIV